MYSKQHEIEGLVENLIEDIIIKELTGSLDSPSECRFAIELLKEKLEELDVRVFDDSF